jgi:hypothetical protein
MLPPEREKTLLIPLEQIVRVTRQLEEQLDAKQFSLPASHNAAEEPQVGIVD